MGFKVKGEPKGSGHVDKPATFPTLITTFEGEVELPGGKATDGQDGANHQGDAAGKPFGPAHPPDHKPFKVKGG